MANQRPKLPSNTGIRHGRGRPAIGEKRRVGLKDELAKATKPISFRVTAADHALVHAAHKAHGEGAPLVGFVMGLIKDGLAARERAAADTISLADRGASATDFADLRDGVTERVRLVEEAVDAMITQLRGLARHQQQTGALIDALGVKIDMQTRAIGEARGGAAKTYRGDGYTKKLPFDDAAGAPS